MGLGEHLAGVYTTHEQLGSYFARVQAKIFKSLI